jgi:hypothetical protein
MKTTLLFLSVFLFASLFGQNVYIPDANFKAYLVGNSAINTNSDTEIQLSEASTFTGTIACNGQNIYDLTGIEAFTALTLLNCQVNQLTSLDISNNIALEVLYCALNQLTSLDLASNTSLTLLDCYGNQLTSLDVSNNTSLGLMGCGSNQLSSLDVSNNTVLAALVCENNQLECLNFKNENNILLVTFQASGNPNLTCIEVDDVNYSSANWTSIDPWAYFSTDCNNNGCLCVPSFSSTDVITACDSYTWLDGNTYTASNNTATYTITNAEGCDSTITLDLTIWSAPEPTIIQNGSTLACTNFASGYQWLDCDANYNPIIGETGMTFTATQSGNYALEISFNDCSDISECFSIDFAGIGELNNTTKQLIKIVDVLGRETPFKPKTPLIYIYDDGSIHKVFSVEY